MQVYHSADIDHKLQVAWIDIPTGINERSGFEVNPTPACHEIDRLALAGNFR